MSCNDALFAQIRFVLVETSHPGNIGAAARAMKVMGFHHLVLVRPKKFPHPQAFWRAKHAEDIVENAVVVATLAQAVADCHFVYGTSARQRSLPWPRQSARACARDAYAALQSNAKTSIAFVFGREDSGLNNEELQRCTKHATIPANRRYSSLNLAQAVQIIAYELFQLAEESPPQVPGSEDWDAPVAPQHQVELLLKHLEQVLTQIEFFDQDNPRKLMPRMRRFFQRAVLDTNEVGIWRGILTSMQKNCK